MSTTGTVFSATNTDDASNDTEDSQRRSLGHVASFVLLIAGLEKRLEDDSSAVFSTNTTFDYSRTPLGSGNSFTVERAEWPAGARIGGTHNKRGKYVALKYARLTESTGESIRWKEILLEIRALLHEPIRYHPNIVRFLGLSWGSAQDSGSNIPVLIMEYSKFGSLAHLQLDADLPLSLKVKMKLCHDVFKGLSILHACDIVHGDLKHENVLIFRTSAEAEYTAKLGDFGGSVMDLERENLSLHVGTPPYNAPEMGSMLNGQALKLTDVYSFGLLVWRVMLDGEHPVAGFSEGGYQQAQTLKCACLDGARECIWSYFVTRRWF